MLTPEDIKQQAVNRFPDVVHAHLNGVSAFPWDVRFGRADTTESLGNLRRQIELLLGSSHAQIGHGYRVNLVVRRTRLHQEQPLPERVWFETLDDYLRFIKQSDALQQIRSEFDAFAEAAPEAAAWLRSRGRTYFRRVIEAGGRSLGLAVHALHCRPQPGCFAREIHLPGVSGKFIEDRLRLIAEILEGIGSPAWKEAPELHSQLGLRETTRILRVMLLDGSRMDYGVNETRFSVPMGVVHVLVVENLRSFLTLPNLPGALAIFGEGRAAETLHRVVERLSAPLYYWGDMDAYGYSILNALRSDYPAARSVLMSRFAFERHRDLISPCDVPAKPHFDRLSAEEKEPALETCRTKMGIEQEKIPTADVWAALNEALAGRFPTKHRAGSSDSLTAPTAP